MFPVLLNVRIQLREEIFGECHRFLSKRSGIAAAKRDRMRYCFCKPVGGFFRIEKYIDLCRPHLELLSVAVLHHLMRLHLRVSALQLDLILILVVVAVDLDPRIEISKVEFAHNILCALRGRLRVISDELQLATAPASYAVRENNSITSV